MKAKTESKWVFKPVSRSLWRRALFVPLAFLVLLTAGFWLGDWDRGAMSLLYEGGKFIYKESQFSEWVYKYATLPALAFGIFSLLYVLAELVRKQKTPFFRVALMLFLTLLVGPGLVVNAVFKDHYGRPRPIQSETFGGDLPFQPLWVPGRHEAARSFPSGHSSMGFYFFIFYFILAGMGRKRAWWVLVPAVVYGCLIGFVRMMQGGHWPSDVIWSGGMVYYSALAVAWILGIFRPEQSLEEK